MGGSVPEDDLWRKVVSAHDLGGRNDRGLHGLLWLGLCLSPTLETLKVVEIVRISGHLYVSLRICRSIDGSCPGLGISPETRDVS